MACKQAFRLCPRVNPHLNHSQAFPVCENTSVRGNPWCCLCERATVQCTMSDSVGENQVYSYTRMHTHTHTQRSKINDFSTSGTNGSGSPCSKQFSVQQASTRKRGRTGFFFFFFFFLAFLIHSF